MIQAVLLDAYETLIEAPAYATPYPVLYQALDLDREQTEEARRLLLTRPTDGIVSAAGMLAGHFGKAGVPRQVIERAQDELAAHLESFRPMAAMDEVLVQLRDRGLRLALVSNVSSPYKAPIRDLGIPELLDHAVYSCDVGSAKPDAAIFHEALALLGLRPDEAVMVGDDQEADIEGARATGLHAIQVDPLGLEGIPLRKLPRAIDRLRDG